MRTPAKKTKHKIPATKPKRAAAKPATPAIVPLPLKPLSPGDSLAASFSTLYDKAADDVLAAMDVAADDMTPNNVHRFRVAVRRLRSGLRQFRTTKTDVAILKRDDALRALALSFATVRDVDVLQTELIPQLATRLGLQPITRLEEELDKRRISAANKAKSHLSSDQVKGLKKLLADHKAAHKQFLDDGMRKRMLAEHVPHELRRAARRLKKRCRDFESLDIDRLHSARKAAKTLRYTFDLYASLYPERRALEIAVNLKAMQDAFGSLNDLTLTPHLDAILEHAPDDAALSHATGFLKGAMTARADHARADARAAWKIVRSTALFRNGFRLD